MATTDNTALEAKLRLLLPSMSDHTIRGILSWLVEKGYTAENLESLGLNCFEMCLQLQKIQEMKDRENSSGEFKGKSSEKLKVMSLEEYDIKRRELFEKALGIEQSRAQQLEIMNMARKALWYSSEITKQKYSMKNLIKITTQIINPRILCFCGTLLVAGGLYEMRFDNLKN